MKVVEATATFTRPNDTTAYTSGDLVSNNTTAGSVTPMAFYIPYGRGFELYRVMLNHSTTTSVAAQFRVHLYKDSPTVANGDNGVWSSSSSNYLGFVDLDGTGATFTAGGRAVASSGNLPIYIVTDADQTLYGLLEARGAYAPGANESFAITLIGKSYL